MGAQSAPEEGPQARLLRFVRQLPRLSVGARPLPQAAQEAQIRAKGDHRTASPALFSPHSLAPPFTLRNLPHDYTPKNALRCIGLRSALRWPMQRAAMATAVRCVFRPTTEQDDRDGSRPSILPLSKQKGMGLTGTANRHERVGAKRAFPLWERCLHCAGAVWRMNRSAENTQQESHPMAMEARRIPGRKATLWLWKRGECPAGKPPYGYGSAEKAQQESHPMAMEARKVMNESK